MNWKLPAVGAISLSLCAATCAATIPATLKQLITQPVNPLLQKVNIGLVVQSLTSRKILYQYHANHLFTPASILKTFTAAAALAYLKPNYRFHTSILTTGDVKNGTLTGNVYFRFTGDPEFKSKNLLRMIEKLHHDGIDRINGRVYIDRTAFNTVPYPPGWMWDDLSYGFGAPMDAIIINRNKFLLHMKPAKKVGLAPHLSSKLPKNVARFHNRIRTTNRYVKNCPLTIYSDDQNDYTVGGCLNNRWGTQRRSLAIRDVPRYAKALIKNQLKKANVVYHGQVYLRKTPANAKQIVDHLSPTLANITHEMLKDSDNLTTNAVFKTLGRRYYKTVGTWQNSIRALTQILAKPTGINFKHNLINDGAGLSRYNLVTPMQELKVLDYANRNATIRSAFFNALPIAGVDGTLADRMLIEGKSRRIHAKTGSMTGVSTLAGYIESKHQGPLAFVIMINNFVGKRRPMIRLENKICEYLVDAKGKAEGKIHG